MTWLLDLWRQSPARIVAAVSALLIFLVAFGVHLSTDQNGAILGLVSAVIVLLGGELTRSQVSSPNTVASTALAVRLNAAAGPVPNPDGRP
jgi:hypothetical protein